MDMQSMFQKKNILKKNLIMSFLVHDITNFVPT